MKRTLIVGIVLLITGYVGGQIMPQGNRPPRNTVQTSGGGDAFVAGSVAVIDQRGNRQSLAGLFRVFKGTGQVETFVIVVNQDGTRAGRWMPAVDAPLGP